jgi:hypothetical protein
MPKTAKASRPGSSQQSPKGFAALRHWYGKRSTTQLAIVALALLAAGFFGFKQAQIYQERSTYRSAEKQIAAFVDEAAKLAPSTKEVSNGCRHRSEKFSKGQLDCSVGGAIVFSAETEPDIVNILERAYKLENDLNWTHKGDGTESSQRYISKNYIRTNIYNTEHLYCTVSYRYKENDQEMKIMTENKAVLLINASCTGPALKEYY